MIMTEEQKDLKDLLIRDLCARLPYGVKLQKTYDTSEPAELYSIDLEHSEVKFYKYKGEGLTICDVGFIERYGKLRFKPLLFPLSSMTEEQKEEYCQLQQRIIYNSKGIVNEDITEYINWCYENHLDINGLIPKGLSLDATGLNIY